MCLLIALFDSVPGCPLVVGANREEFYDRPSDPPLLLRSVPRTWGGRDRRAGGTWLGLNEHGLFVALTNRRATAAADARSRGLLCLDILETPSAADGVQLLQEKVSADTYTPFNLFLSDGTEAYVVQYQDTLGISRLEAGLYILTHGDLNDLEEPRIRRTQSLLADRAFRSPDEAIGILREMLADHESGVPFRDMICIHGTESGTVSSSILALWPDRLEQSLYYHAEGKPCQGKYRDYSSLLREEAGHS
jgi:uncharacterized protein with NRDE domain